MLSDNIRRIIKEKYRSLVSRPSVEVLADANVEKNIIPGKPLILYVAKRYDYGDKTSGLGLEHYHFYNSLLRLGYSFIYFDYDRLTSRFGAKRMSQMLLECFYQYQPEFLLYFHSRDLVDHSVFSEMSKNPNIKTMIYLMDDSWRFEQTRPVWSLFNVAITTEQEMREKRAQEGFPNVLLSQWAANPFLHKKLNLETLYDVSFVGQAHGDRPEIIKKIRQAGITVATFGKGWEGGRRINQSDFIKIYNQSKIAFNMSYNFQGKPFINSRTFEAVACGSMLITNEAPHLEEYFVAGKEIVTYQDTDEAIEKIKYYLQHDSERKKIALAGWKRAISDHTYEKRLQEIFNHLNRKERKSGN